MGRWDETDEQNYITRRSLQVKTTSSINIFRQRCTSQRRRIAEFHSYNLLHAALGRNAFDLLLVIFVHATSKTPRRSPALQCFSKRKPNRIRNTMQSLVVAGVPGDGIYHYYLPRYLEAPNAVTSRASRSESEELKYETHFGAMHSLAMSLN